MQLINPINYKVYIILNIYRLNFNISRLNIYNAGPRYVSALSRTAERTDIIVSASQTPFDKTKGV